MENYDHFFCSGLSESHVVDLGAKRGSLMSNSTGIAHTFISTLGLSMTHYMTHCHVYDSF